MGRFQVTSTIIPVIFQIPSIRQRRGWDWEKMGIPWTQVRNIDAGASWKMQDRSPVSFSCARSRCWTRTLSLPYFPRGTCTWMKGIPIIHKIGNTPFPRLTARASNKKNSPNGVEVAERLEGTCRMSGQCDPFILKSAIEQDVPIHGSRASVGTSWGSHHPLILGWHPSSEDVKRQA